MRRAGGIVAHHCGRTHEDGARVPDPLKQRLRVRNPELQVLRRVGLRERKRFIDRDHVADRDVVGAGNKSSDHCRKPALEAQENGLAVRSVLGLREQVGGAAGGIRRAIGDQNDLARPGRKVDCDMARDEQLRRRDPAISRADDLVDWRDRVRPERERGHGLGAADRVDLVDAESVSGGKRRL